MSRKNHHYSSELKYQAVGEYLKGQKTLDTVCKKIWDFVRSAVAKLDKDV